MFSHPMPNRLVMGLGVFCLVGLLSTTAPAQNKSQLLFDQAAQQIDAQDYVSAKETLEQVKPAELSPADKDRLSHLILKADHGLAKALHLRQSIAQAQDLADQNKFASARQILNSALSSAQNDPAAQSKIKATLAEIEARQKLLAGKMKKLFNESVKHYKAHRLEQAEQGFKAVIDSGVDLGFWNRGKPQKYLQKIAAQKVQAVEQPTVVTVPKPKPTEPATIVVAPATTPAPQPDKPQLVITQPHTVPLQPARAPRYATGTGPSRTLLAEEVKRRRIITQQITMQHRVAMDRAERLIRGQKFAQARRIVREAQAVLKANQSILPPMNMATMNAFGQSKLAHIDQEERIYQRNQLKEQQVRAVAAAQKALATADQVRQERVKELFSQGATFVQERKYKLALDRYRQVLTIDPNNSSARSLASWLQDTTWFHQAQDTDRQAQAEYQGVIQNTRKAAIPYDRDPPLTWDDNWLELSKRRLKALAGISGENPENVDARKRLSVQHPLFEYQDTPLSEVFDDLREKSGLNIVPNWQSLSAAGVEQTTPVNLQLRNVSVEQTLKAILSTLSSAGYYGTTISHVLQDGIVVIATKEDLAADIYPVVHDISDLLIETGDRRGGPRFEAGGVSGTTGGRGTTGGTRGRRGTTGTGGSRRGGTSGRAGTSSRSRRGDTGGRGVTSSRGRGQTSDGFGEDIREDLLERILELVWSIDPDSWQEIGTGQGMATIYGTKLVIYQTADVHAKIRDMLMQIRDTRPIQISVEPRFLFVTDNFLEDIGIDLDFYLSPQGRWVGPDTRPTTAAGHPGFRAGVPAPLVGTQGSSVFSLPASTGIPGSLGGASAPTAFTIAGSFLDKLEVDFLLRATQASRKATTLTAPRVTFENAGGANIFVGRQVAYISDASTNVEENAVGIDVTPDILETGPTLNVGGVVSPDRRFVRLDIEVSLSDLISLPSVADLVPTAAALTPELALIQLPVMDTTTISTQVSVPDGGALLIGGLRRSGEEKKEAGVPILNKIPYLNRWFTNKSFITDKHVLVILLRPRIIDLKEEQGLTHPMLGER